MDSLLATPSGRCSVETHKLQTPVKHILSGQLCWGHSAGESQHAPKVRGGRNTGPAKRRLCQTEPNFGQSRPNCGQEPNLGEPAEDRSKAAKLVMCSSIPELAYFPGPGREPRNAIVGIQSRADMAREPHGEMRRLLPRAWEPPRGASTTPPLAKSLCQCQWRAPRAFWRSRSHGGDGQACIAAAGDPCRATAAWAAHAVKRRPCYDGHSCGTPPIVVASNRPPRRTKAPGPSPG